MDMKRIGIGIAWMFILLFSVSLAGAEQAAPWPVEAPGEEEAITVEWVPTEDPAQGYINKHLYPNRRVSLFRARRTAGDRLTDDSRRLYLQLLPLIAQVAAGELASTEFVLPPEDVYETTAWSKEDLEVDVLVADGHFTAEAMAAVSARLKAVNPTAVIHALMADCPFELYWYDKTIGAGARISYPGYFTRDGETVTLNGSVTVKMTVSQEYSAGDYLVDTAYGQGVQAAADNAQAIVAQYENCPDDERLLAYKNAICDSTAYNYAALNDGTPYGNPWQLVWVFDGNDDTKVVCEGYAKAFQYLNDLSASSVTVLSVTGTMNGGRHMWNIVAMDDGRNYLVDVTNCDSDMSGYPDQLFLVGCGLGNPMEGYPVAVTGGTLTYCYDEMPLFSEADLTLAAWNYEMDGPPVPNLSCAQAELYANEAVTVAEGFSGCLYDSLIAEITRADPAGGEAELLTLTADGPQQWTLGHMEAGEYTLRFSGVRDGVQSGWTDSEELCILGMAELVPVFTVSTVRGYVGYRLAVRLPSDADAVYVQETEEEWPCQGRDLLIPLTSAGSQTYTLALLWQGEASAFGEPVTVEVAEMGAGTLTIPPGTETIEDEAFRGCAAARVTIPDSVTQIGLFAFADCEFLQIAEIGQATPDESVFDNCPQLVYCFQDTDRGFACGQPFVVP